MLNKKVSLKDIAQQVGVSIALVSYVLNNKNEGRISKMVAQKIREVAKELNYQTNQIAKSLKTNRTFTIGLILSDISNPFSSSLARIIEDEADKNNYTVIFGSSDENLQKSWKLMDTFLNRKVDGLIIAAPENAEPQICYLQQQKIPFVLIDRYFPDIPTNYVALDNFKAADAAVQHLIGMGYKRIGMVTYDSSLFNLRQRTEGYVSALRKSDIVFNENWLKLVKNDTIKSDIEKAVKDLVSHEEPVDAILFGSNVIASCGLKCIHSLNINVPGELGIVTFDETALFDLFYAPLSYIRQPLKEMGAEATRILIDTLAGNEITTQIKMEADLIIRLSSMKSVRSELSI